MSNVVAPPQFTVFPLPYRITIVRERLEEALKGKGCEITVEPLVLKNDAQAFPNMQHDTARVFVRRGTLSVNVLGLIEDGRFHYRAWAYEEESLLGGGTATMDQLDALIEQVAERFA